MRALLGPLVTLLAALTACATSAPPRSPLGQEAAPVVEPASSPSDPLPIVAAPLPETASTPTLPAPPPPPPPEPPEPGAELPAAPYLTPGAGRRYPRRTLLAKDGPIRLDLAGEWATQGPARALGAPLEGIVVEEHPRSLRVVLSDKQVRLALYVRRDALHAVSVRSSWLSPVPDRAPDPAAGSRVAPGTVLDEKERRGALCRVTGQVEEVSFEGWLQADEVGAVFVPERFPTPPQDGLLAEGTVVTAPGGEVLARLRGPSNASSPPRFDYDASLLRGAPAGFQAVHLRRAGIEVRGLVPASAAQRKPWGLDGLGLTGIGEGGGGAVSDTEHLLLRAGAGLFSAAGARVGVALRATEVWVGIGSRQSAEPRVGATMLLSSFGFVVVRVKPRDLRPLQGG